MTAHKISTTHSKIVLSAFPLGVDRVDLDEAWEDTQAEVAKATAAQSPVKKNSSNETTSLLRAYSLNTPYPVHLLCHLCTIPMVNAGLRPRKTLAVLEPAKMKPQLDKTPIEHDELTLDPA